MDLSSMLNDDGRDRQPPPSRFSQQHSSMSTPVTPGPPVPQPPARGPYQPNPQRRQHSPTRQMSHDSGPLHFSASPAGANPGPYASRPAPAPPPVQPPGPIDPRSPGSAVAAPSPYRQIPSADPYGAPSAFPFPGAPQSPSQRHQYSPAAGPLQSRETFPSPMPQAQPQQGPPTPITHPGHNLPHLQPLPQTPPVNGPVPPQKQPHQQQQAQYVHQRSQSSHSTSTPTSAHSQHHYSAGFPHQQPQQQASPIVPNHPLPDNYMRQASQPPTPLGPPQSAGHRQASGASYGHPTSPYQARVSVASVNHQHPHHQQTSPPPLPPPSLPRMASTQSVYESPSATDGHVRSHSQARSDRNRSISVSPKTRAPSIPRGHSERATTPAKRKLSDVDGVEHPREAQRPAMDLNGAAVPQHIANAQGRKRKRRPAIYRDGAPVWACAHDGGFSNLQHGNWALHKRGPKKEKMEEEELFEDVAPQGHPHAPHGGASGGGADGSGAGVGPGGRGAPEGPRLPWDVCIGGGTLAVSAMSKAVADFLFTNVVMNQYQGEIRAHNIQFEVEAKLGVIIDKRTDNRIDLPVASECVLDHPSQFNFQSSITEREHRGINEFLNHIVFETEPRNPRRDPARLAMSYQHRREVDEFFELPQDQREQLPACVESLFHRRHAVKVRVTKEVPKDKPKDHNGRIIAVIIKARVGNLHLHFPECPLDCRISINLEMPWDGPIPKEITSPDGNDAMRRTMAPGDRSERKKDRLSYRQGVFQVDLTQVTSTSRPLPNQPANIPPRVQKDHELEVELSGEELLRFGEEARQGNADPYTAMVDSLLENVRLLTSKCREIRQATSATAPG